MNRWFSRSRALLQDERVHRSQAAEAREIAVHSVERCNSVLHADCGDPGVVGHASGYARFDERLIKVVPIR